MALTQIIKDLLYTCDKLIIPGFGGFVAQKISSKINNESEVILPPGKYFSFDSTLQDDADTFVELVSTRLSVSRSEAQTLVKNFTDDLKQRIANQEKVQIEGLGYFSLDENKNVSFVSFDNTNFHPDSYGLTSVRFKLPHVVVYPSYDEKSSGWRSIPVQQVLMYSLLGILALGIAGTIYWKFDVIKEFFHSKPSVPVFADTTVKKPLADTSAIDTSGVAQSIDTSTHIKNALYYKEPVKKDTVHHAEVSSAVKYYLIAGSFQSYQKAEKHAHYLKAQGFAPEIIEFSQQLFRVSIGIYNSKEEADKAIETLKSKKGAENVWRVAK